LNACSPRNQGHPENGTPEGEPDWHLGSGAKREGEDMRPTTRQEHGLRGSIERRIQGLIEAFRPNVRPYMDPTECSAEEDDR